jgi:anthranilate synthase
MQTQTYQTDAGITVDFSEKNIVYQDAILPLLNKLNDQRGALYTSSFEFPGRYTCWDIGFVNPPIVLTSKDRTLSISALNSRGEVLLQIMKGAVSSLEMVEVVTDRACLLTVNILKSTQQFSEEERSLQPSVFSVIRALIALFSSKACPYLGFYGAWGYDLIFQFEQLEKSKIRNESDREMVIYLPDEIYIVNHRKETAVIRQYEFSFDGLSTENLSKDAYSSDKSVLPNETLSKKCDHKPGEYAKTVLKAHEKFKQGDLFEVVPSQTFYAPCEAKPSDIFTTLRDANPAPYGFLINLGEEEYLIGASPEMYVRVNGKRVETCPISGTIERGKTALQDATQIQTLLSSEKECAELTMCTDVDRNDKSRICEPGSVKVIGRRQIEMYSRLIHTVDHVEGSLREGYDAIDAFLTHMWVVTVTGAPKLWAMQFIEEHEKSPRNWYAGAVGWFGFNGDLNTGLTLRTIRLKSAIAQVRAGATLLFDSVPTLEEEETRLKARALMHVLLGKNQVEDSTSPKKFTGKGKRVLLIDNEDSFVHTLANYFRQTGASVVTTRHGLKEAIWNEVNPHLVVISPGPGRPKDFSLDKVIEKAKDRNVTLFGVCLGFQAIVEYFGGELKVLDYPMHGKSSEVVPKGEGLFKHINTSFVAARYHSLYAPKKSLPDKLMVTAESKDGVVMAIEVQNESIFGVQFHPEAILSLEDEVGLSIIERVMELTAKPKE